jgi:hypothetical protein
MLTSKKFVSAGNNAEIFFGCSFWHKFSLMARKFSESFKELDNIAFHLCPNHHTFSWNVNK